jgi:plasmid stability protein
MKIALALILSLLLCAVASGQDKLQHAVDLYRSGDYQNAAVELEGLNSAGAENNLSDLYLGAAYAHLNKESEARDVLKRAHRTGEKPTLNEETAIKLIKTPRADLREITEQIQ